MQVMRKPGQESRPNLADQHPIHLPVMGGYLEVMHVPAPATKAHALSREQIAGRGLDSYFRAKLPRKISTETLAADLSAGLLDCVKVWNEGHVHIGGRMESLRLFKQILDAYQD